MAVAEAAGAGLAIGMMILIFSLILIILSIFFFVFWILMIVDAANRKFKNQDDRVMWILIIVLAHFIGAIIYYFIIKHPDKH